MATEKDEGSRTRLQSAKKLAAGVAAQTWKRCHQGSPPSLLVSSPLCSPGSRFPSASLPLLCPWGPSSPIYGTFLTVNPTLSWHPLGMGTGYFLFIQKKAPFLLQRPQTLSWLRLQDPRCQSGQQSTWWERPKDPSDAPPAAGSTVKEHESQSSGFQKDLPFFFPFFFLPF